MWICRYNDIMISYLALSLSRSLRRCGPRPPPRRAKSPGAAAAPQAPRAARRAPPGGSSGATPSAAARGAAAAAPRTAAPGDASRSRSSLRVRRRHGTQHPLFKTNNI